MKRSNRTNQEIGSSDTGLLVGVLLLTLVVSLVIVTLGWIESVKDARTTKKGTFIESSEFQSGPIGPGSYQVTY